MIEHPRMLACTIWIFVMVLFGSVFYCPPLSAKGLTELVTELQDIVDKLESANEEYQQNRGTYHPDIRQQKLEALERIVNELIALNRKILSTPGIAPKLKTYSNELDCALAKFRSQIAAEKRLIDEMFLETPLPATVGLDRVTTPRRSSIKLGLMRSEDVWIRPFGSPNEKTRLVIAPQKDTAITFWVPHEIWREVKQTGRAEVMIGDLLSYLPWGYWIEFPDLFGQGIFHFFSKSSEPYPINQQTGPAVVWSSPWEREARPLVTLKTGSVTWNRIRSADAKNDRAEMDCNVLIAQWAFGKKAHSHR